MQEDDTTSPLTMQHGPAHLQGDLIGLKYIPLSAVRSWDRNPKKHDLQKLVESIETHGFRDPPAYDVQLDAFVEGNGRTEALQWMARHGRERPRGIALDVQTGEWCIPVIFGVDAKSRLAAERYGIDHNNLVLAGGDFTAADYARNWDPRYAEILQELAHAQQLPVSIDGDDLDALLAVAGVDTHEGRDAPIDEGEEPRGSLLELAAIARAEPRHKPIRGETYHLVGGQFEHLLISADVYTDWAIWAPHLRADTDVFLPYPGPFVSFSELSLERRLVMVQPDYYVAGHLLDEWENIHGEGSVRKGDQVDTAERVVKKRDTR